MLYRICFILLLALVPVAFSQGSRATTAVVAVNLDSSSMNPWLSTTVTDKNVVTHIYDTLLARDAEMNVVPNVATSYRTLDDLTWEFVLRDDVFFTNGEQLTAHSVAYTMQHFRDPDLGAPSIAQFSAIESIEAVDEFTVHIKTSVPFPSLPAILVEFWIIPEVYTASVGGLGLSDNPIGSGPYLFESWTRDDRIVLRANENWWNGTPAIEFVEFRVVPSQGTRIAQAQTGEADIVSQVPSEAVASIERQPNVDVVRASNPRAFFLTLNQRYEGPLQNLAVRQAMNYAIDVDAIVEFIFEGAGRPLATLFTPEQFGFDSEIEPYGYNPELAREMLAEAGYPDGFTIQMEGPIATYPKDTEVAQYVVSQLAAVGITVELNLREWGGFIGQFRTEDGPEMFFLSWSIPTFDPDALLTPLVTANQVYSRYTNSDLQQLVDEARSIVNPEERAAVYGDVQRMLKEQAPMIFLYQLDAFYAVSSRLDWQPRPDERIYLWEASLR